MELKRILIVMVIGIAACCIYVGGWKYEFENKTDRGETVEQSREQEVSSWEGESMELQVPVTEPPKKEETKAPQIIATEPPQTQIPRKSQTETAPEPKEEIAKEPQKVTKEPQVVSTKEPDKPIAEEVITPTHSPIQDSLMTPKPNIQSSDSPEIPGPPASEAEHVHEFEKAVWELPTCQKGGYYNNICKICGLVESVTQEPLSHEVTDIVIQEGNCMEDRVIRHICKNCEIQVESDTRYPVYDVHLWKSENVDGELIEYCERCGVVK